MLGFVVEMVPIEHEGSRAALFRLFIRGAQGSFIGGALGLATVFVVPSEFLLPAMVICGAAGALFNIRLTVKRHPRYQWKIRVCRCLWSYRALTWTRRE